MEITYRTRTKARVNHDLSNCSQIYGDWYSLELRNTTVICMFRLSEYKTLTKGHHRLNTVETTKGTNMKNLKDMVKDKVVNFQFYQNKELVYETECGFRFPVPINDTGSGQFRVQDKAMLFMRYIRKELEVQKDYPL